MPQNEGGDRRQVGIELEYGELSLEETARIIQDHFGGQIEGTNRFYQKVVGTSLGDFTLEVDSRLLTQKSYEAPLRKLGFDPDQLQVGDQSLAKALESLLSETAVQLVPFEIGAPPIPFDQLPRLDELRAALHQAGAVGTRASWAFAFGLHLNPEAPQQSVDSILQHLRAFLVLYPWLLRDGQIDLSRRVSPFIDPFPQSYLDRVFAADYAPDGPQLVQDYYADNPDRNRPLDLYPLLAHRWPDEVAALEDIGKLSARPTYHYRLPNCDIDRADWSLIEEWNRWVTIERLAQQPDHLRDLMAQYLQQQQDTLFNFGEQWAKHLTQTYFNA